MVENMVAPGSAAGPTPDPDRPKMDAPAPLRAVHTPNFPALLRRLGASSLVTTYQGGKLVLVRDQGDHLNTHFRAFRAPMGPALSGDRLAFGTTVRVWEFVDVPTVSANASGLTGTIYPPAAQLTDNNTANLNVAMVVDLLSISGNGVADSLSFVPPPGAVGLTVTTPGLSTPSAPGRLRVPQARAPVSWPWTSPSTI